MLEIKEKVNLAPYTTFGIGGPAEYFAVVESEDELMALVGERYQSITVLGGGSNVLIDDAGIKGLVIKNEIKGVTSVISGDQVLVTAGAGEDWDGLVALTVKEGWWGLENLSAIPGSVGATPIQNVGAYGVEIASLIKSVRVFDIAQGLFRDFTNEECVFGYRDSFFKTEAGRMMIVTKVTYSLSLVPAPKLHYKDLAARFALETDSNNISQTAIRDAVIEIRAGKFPDWKQIGTAGSFFKNPVIDKVQYESLVAQYPGLPGYPEKEGKIKVSLGWILDNICDVKGLREGNVGLYEKQALVLVNFGGATALQIKSFADKIRDEVFKKTQIEIEMEVRVL